MSGILRLESLTKGNTLKQGDKTPLKYRLFDADGEKLNIAGKPAQVRLVYPDFLTIGYEKAGLTVAQDDTVTFTIDNVIPAKLYHVEIIVDDKFIFPSRADESKFTVDKSSLGTESSIIEIVGVDAVVRKAVDLINKDPNLIIDEDKLVSDIISNTGIGSIEEYHQQFNDVIMELSEDKDYYSLPEIAGARGGFDTLGERLNNTATQLAQKVGGGKLAEMGDLSQKVKEAMTGGSVAVVGEDAVGTVNIQDNAVTTGKIQNLTLGTNLHNRKTDLVDTSVDATNGSLIPLAGTITSDFIEISGLTDISLIGYNQVCMYDKNYDYMSNFYYAPADRGNPQYQKTREGTAYVRVTYSASYVGSPHINVGTELLPYEDFKYKFRFLETDGSYIKNRSVSNEKLSDLTTGTNLFNNKTITPKSNLTLPGGDVIPHDTYAVTDFIKVERGSTLIFKNFFNAVEYDDEGKYIKYSFFSGADRPKGTPLKLSEKTTAVRGIYNADLLAESELQINIGNTLLEWEPFRHLDKHGQWGVTSSRLYGKTLLNLGDSIAEAYGMLGYSGQIASKYSMTHHNYGRGGATIRKISSEPLNHTVEEQLDQTIADGIEPDYVLFNGNTNDWGNISMGEISDDYTTEVDIETYYGAFESLLRKLKTNFPEAKIIYVSAHKMSSRDLSEKHRFTQAGYEICERYSTPYVDVFGKSTMNTFFDNFIGKYTISPTDATHPNERGYEKYYVPLIENVLNSI